MSEHVIIGSDRYITVPESLHKVGVQFDHNVETITFDCPRYWDGQDLSAMRVYINYMRPDESVGAYLCDATTVDASDNTIMHFDWTIDDHVTEIAGQLVFLVCIRQTNEDGEILAHWNSEINTDLYVSAGMKCRDAVIRRYPDIISLLLERMDVITGGSLTGKDYATKQDAQGYANSAEARAKIYTDTSDIDCGTW